jgi:hypothetical protein
VKCFPIDLMAVSRRTIEVAILMGIFRFQSISPELPFRGNIRFFPVTRWIQLCCSLRAACSGLCIFQFRF